MVPGYLFRSDQFMQLLQKLQTRLVLVPTTTTQLTLLRLGGRVRPHFQRGSAWAGLC